MTYCLKIKYTDHMMNSWNSAGQQEKMEKIKIFMPHSFLQAVSLLMQCITHL